MYLQNNKGKELLLISTGPPAHVLIFLILPLTNFPGSYSHRLNNLDIVYTILI